MAMTTVTSTTESGIHKRTTVPVPVRLFKPHWPRGAAWSAQADLPVCADRYAGRGWIAEASGKTESAVRTALANQILAVLTAADQRLVLVIGGGPDYADCIHLVRARAEGTCVDIIRAGRSAGSWSSGSGLVTEVDHVIEHVGGAPHVVAVA
jgi:hypothetical protein